ADAGDLQRPSNDRRAFRTFHGGGVGGAPARCEIKSRVVDFRRCRIARPWRESARDGWFLFSVGRDCAVCWLEIRSTNDRNHRRLARNLRAHRDRPVPDLVRIVRAFRAEWHTWLSSMQREAAQHPISFTSLWPFFIYSFMTAPLILVALPFAIWKEWRERGRTLMLTAAVVGLFATAMLFFNYSTTINWRYFL